VGGAVASEGAAESNVSFTGPTGNPPAEKVMLVTGTGTDENSAIKNALARAVEKAVGVVVDAQNVVENEKLITEKILTYSDEIVSSYTAVRGWRDGALVNVKGKATIEMRALVVSPYFGWFSATTRYAVASHIQRVRSSFDEK